MKSYLTSVAALAILTACSPESGTAPDLNTDSQLNQTESSAETNQTGQENPSDGLIAMLDEFTMQELQYSPTTLTQLGMIDDLELYGQWDDPSREAAQAEADRKQGYLDALREQYDPATLEGEARIAYGFADYVLENDLINHGYADQNYAYSQMGLPVSTVVTFLVNNHRVESVDHANAYISRIRNSQGYLDTLREQGESRAENGIILPRQVFPRLIDTTVSALNGAPFDDSGEDSVLLADFRTKVEALDLPEAETRSLIEEATAALSENFQPAVEAFHQSLLDLESRADDRAGIWKFPNGEAVYENWLRVYTTSDRYSADEIHQIGLDEVARLRGEMEAIMADVGFEGTLNEFFDDLLNREDNFYPDTEEGKQEYLEAARAYVEGIEAVAPEYFDTLPEAGVEVRAVEPFREASAPIAFYNAPSLDGSRPGYYYVNLVDMTQSPKHLIEAIAYHEAVPGHHFQIALQQELENVAMIQRLNGFSYFSEGWGLYSELLAREMGFYEDPYSNFGRLSTEMFRAVRLVVDTGMHDQQWTRQEAIDYMKDNLALSEADIIREIDRYMVIPGQAVSYKMGMITLLELRADARERLGDRFDIGGFHDAVLTAGSLPDTLLRERVETWIQSVENAQ